MSLSVERARSRVGRALSAALVALLIMVVQAVGFEIAAAMGLRNFGNSATDRGSAPMAWGGLTIWLLTVLVSVVLVALEFRTLRVRRAGRLTLLVTVGQLIWAVIALPLALMLNLALGFLLPSSAVLIVSWLPITMSAVAAWAEVLPGLASPQPIGSALDGP